MELVSILIPCYNDGVYLDDALTSVEAQTWPAVEVIVVDDGSTDPDTVATLDRLAGEKRCTLYRQANKGPSAARNLAAQKASGAYYFFLDADNILLPTYIEKALEQFRRNPKLGVCYARAELFGDASGLWELPEFSVQQMLIDNVVDMCALVSREAFEAVGGFDESIHGGLQDYDIFLSMIEKGYAFYRIPEMLFHYRIRPTSMTAALVKNPDVVQQLYQQIYRKHKGLYLEHLDEVYPALRKAMGDTKTLQALLDQERKNVAAVQAEHQKAVEGWNQTAEDYRSASRQLQAEQRRAEESGAQLTALLAQHDKAIDGWNKTAAEYMQTAKELAQERKRLEELQAEHDRMNAACAQALKELAQERRRLEELQAEHDRMTAACAQALEKEKERTAAALQDRDRIIADDRAAEEKLQHDLLDISRRFAEAQRELESRAQEAARLREEIGKEQAQSISLTEERNQLSARANELKVAHDYAVSQWSQAARTIELLQQELQNVRNEVSLITNGISWKVTKPLRYGKKLLKKGVARVGLLGWRTGRTVYRAVRRGCRRKAALTAAQAALAGTWPPHFEKQPDRVPASTLEQANVKRLGIFTFYEKDGVVDGYVLYFLEHLVKLTERLVIVVNGKLSTDGRKALQKITGEIVLRDNTGFDAWGVREGLMHVGLKKVAGYDELIVANDTNFGPVLPLEDMVNTMAARKVDFWGISSHAGFESDPFQCNPYGFVPEHVQSYFYAVRRSLLGSEVFRRFWTELPALPDYNHAVGLYETVMTRYFTEHGYTWSTYMDAEAYYPLTDNPLIAAPVEAIRDYHCPIFKRRAFFQDYDYLTTYTGQHTAAQLMQYLEEETDYPTDLIWENLIRTVHMCDLVQNLHLAQILDKHHYYGPAPQRLQESINAALFMHIYDTSMAAEMAAYAASMPPEADVFISTTSEEKKQQILACFGSLPNQLEIRVCPNRGRDVSGLLANFKDVVMNYAVICVTHDKKTAYLKPETVGEGFAYMGYENILGSRAFVLNVLNAFARNKYLGLLYTPDPNHADFGTHIGLEWGPNFAATKELAQALHLHVPMDEKKPPCAPFGSNFWARSDALKPLFDKDWTYEDFPPEPFKALDGSILHAVERIYPYSAQQAGYYSALLMTTDYSAIELGNLQYNAQAYAHVCFDHGIANRYITVRDLLDMRLTTLEEAGYVPAVTVNESGQVVPAAGAGFLQKIRGRVYNLAGKVKRTLDRWNEQ